MAVQSISIAEYNTTLDTNKILNPQRNYLFITITYASPLNESTYNTTVTNVNKIFDPIKNNIPKPEGTDIWTNTILWPYYIVYKNEYNGSSEGFYYSTIARYTNYQYIIEFQGFNPSNNKISYLQICEETSSRLKFYNFEYSPN